MSADQIAEARRLKEIGLTISGIARALGVSRYFVLKAIQGGQS